MTSLLLLLAALALFVYELGRAIVRAFDLEDPDEVEQLRRPGGGWRN